MLPLPDVAATLWKWGAEDIAIDAFHHAVYVAFTALAFDALQTG